MAPETHPAGNGPPAARTCPWIGRAVVLALLALLVAEIALEASSRICYHRSLDALQERLQSAWQSRQSLNFADAAKVVAGWPATSEKNVGRDAQIEYHWPSFVWDLRIQLQRRADGAVMALTIGRDAAPAPLPRFVPGPGPLSPLPENVPVRIPRGLLATSAPAVALDLKGTGFAPDSVEQGYLVRELVRQSLLIAARDELGLPTRDRVLGDALPDEGDATLPVLNVTTSIDAERRVQVIVAREFRGGTEGEIAAVRFQLPAGPLIDRLAAKSESLSADEFTAALKKAGYAGQPNQYATAGPVTKEIEANLERFEALSQFAAIRALHAQIRESGESPERLAALSRAYAHLGTLTQFLFIPARRVYTARSLLYSERLVRKTAGSPAALWNRAYVRALAGMHVSALEDLSAARAADKGGPAPGWAIDVEDACRSNAAWLSDPGEEPESPLSSYLRLLAAAPSEIPSVRLEAATRLLRTEPDCTLAIDVMVDQAPLGVRRQMSGQAFSGFAGSLNRYLESAADLPAEIREPAAAESAEPGGDSEARARLVATLRDPARSGEDRGEPSLAALAELIHDTSFVHAVRLLHMEQFALAVDTGETMARLKPILKGHRYELFAGVFVRDQMAAAQALQNLRQTTDREQFELPANLMLDVYKMYQADRDTAEAAVAAVGDAIVRHGDRVYGDLARALRIHASDQVKRDVAAALREVSPGSPLGIAAALRYDWDRSQSSADAWEKEFPENLAVLGALADRYTALDRYDDAVRCRRRQLEFLPDQTVFQSLAKLYKDHGHEQLWFQTLTASLEAPAFGLEHPHPHADLADYHMRRGEWDLARPHAEQAAAAYSARGLLCAADFFERTGNWRRAEAFHRANTERYASHGADLDWYRWCRRTGRGDVVAARALAQDYVTKLKEWPSAEARDTVGMYFVLEDQPAEALQAFRAAAGFESNEPYHSLHAALLADELGDAAQRDELLKEAHARGLRKNGSPVEIVSAFRNALDGGSDRLDLPAIDWVIRDRSVAGSPTNEFYFVGKFLMLRGRVAEGREYLQRAATSPMTGKFNATLAACALVKAGIAVGERRNDEFDEETVRRLEPLQRANRLYNSGKGDEALVAYGAAIEACPDFADARLARSMAFRLHDDFDQCLADLTRAHELIPRCPRFLVRRAEVLEYLGRYAAAIDDYEAALAFDPLNGFAHYNMALLCAACPEASFRDGARAQEHARQAQELSEAPPHLALALLAAADAESGEFDQAVRLQAEAVLVTPADAKAQSQERLQLFQRKEPYRRRPGWWKKP